LLRFGAIVCDGPTDQLGILSGQAAGVDKISGSGSSVDMAAVEPHWVYQGRQSHGWFGSGTGPGRDVAPANPHYGDLFAPANVGNRVAYAAHSLFVHLSERDAKHPTAKAETATTENLKTAVAAWYGARNLSRDAFQALLLDPSTKNSTVDRLPIATRGFVEAHTPEVLNAANGSWQRQSEWI
jgi:hypothetical protein